jgi:pimeloyl-ACP methyl ester carboxylesterase
VANLYRSADGEQRVRDWCSGRLERWPVPHRTWTVPTSLGRTHLVEAGEGDRVCLYLPGTNFNAATSLGLLTALAARCRVVAVDLPGQPGLSSSTRPLPEAEGYGRWLDEVVPAVRAEHPGRAILRTAVPWMLRPRPERSLALLRLMSGPASRPDPDLASWLTLVARETRTTGAPGPLAHEVVARWRGRPARVLVGEDDCFFPPERVGRVAADRMGIHVDVLEGLGHFAVEEAPERVAALIAP